MTSFRRILRNSSSCLVAVAIALTLTACGSTTGGDRPDTSPRLLLDFTPNAVHSGIYLASQRGFDTAEGVKLRIRKPGQSTDALKLLKTGRVDMAILDIHDLGLARERGEDIVGVMALVQRPLAAVLAEPDVKSPRDLEGQRVGVTGLPSDDAVLDSVVRGAGGDPASVKKTTIGFESVKTLLAGRVAGATAFWNVEGVALKAARPTFKEFRVDDFGAPPYPELILTVTRDTLQDRADEIRAVIRTLQRGYVAAQNEPDSAVGAMLEREPALDRASLSAQLDAVAPAFTEGAPAYGALSRTALAAWAKWDVTFGILQRTPNVKRAFDFSLVGPADQP